MEIVLNSIEVKMEASKLKEIEMKQIKREKNKQPPNEDYRMYYRQS